MPSVGFLRWQFVLLDLLLHLRLPPIALFLLFKLLHSICIFFRQNSMRFLVREHLQVDHIQLVSQTQGSPPLLTRDFPFWGGVVMAAG